MSTGAPSARGKGSGQKSGGSMMSRDLGSLFSRKKTNQDDEVEHPPFVPILPAVNLLPISVRNSIAVARVRRILVLVALLLVLLGAVIWFVQGSTISQAESDLARSRAETQSLKSQVDSLAAVQGFYTQLQSQKELVTATLASQAQTTEVVKRLTDAGTRAGGDPIAFSSVGITYVGIPTPGGEVVNTCPNPDPFGTEITIGCLTFTAEAANRQEVSNLLDAMAEDPLFVGPYVSSTTLGQTSDTGQKRVTFTGTAGISLDALETPLTQEQIDAILAPPPAADEAAPAPSGEAQ